MSTSPLFVLISIIVIGIVVALVFFAGGNRAKNHLSPLAGLSFGFIVAGLLFGEIRFFAYGMMALGVILAVVDIFIKEKTK